VKTERLKTFKGRTSCGFSSRLHCALIISNSLFFHGRIGGHDTENFYNDMYTGTINVILVKHKL